MWLSRKLSQHEMQDVASAQDGTVTVEGGELAVFSSGEKREVKTAAPGGYEWQPKKGEDVLVVRGGTFGEEAYAVGAVGQSADDLAPGEVRIRSAAAGTEIVLRNNGRIDINGLLSSTGCRIWEWGAEDGAEDQRPRLCGRRRGRARARERLGRAARTRAL